MPPMKVEPISKRLVKNIREFLKEKTDLEDSSCWDGTDNAAYDLLAEVLLHSTGEII